MNEAGHNGLAAHSVEELVKPVGAKLNEFNPGVEYDRKDILLTLKKIIMSGRINGLALTPDQNKLNPGVSGNNYALLVAVACKVYVDLIIYAKFPRKKRISQQQRKFAFELESEIHRLENGEGLFAAFE